MKDVYRVDVLVDCGAWVSRRDQVWLKVAKQKVNTRFYFHFATCSERWSRDHLKLSCFHCLNNPAEIIV